MVVGQALTAVGALETGTVQDILADFDLAVSLRQLHASPGPAGTAAPGTGPPGPLPPGALQRDYARRGGGPPGRPDPGRPFRPADPGGQAGGQLAGREQPDHRDPRTRGRPITTRIRGWLTGSSRSG